MAEEVHQSVADAITDVEQVAGVRPETSKGAPMNDDDEVVTPGTGDQDVTPKK